MTQILSAQSAVRDHLWSFKPSLAGMLIDPWCDNCLDESVVLQKSAQGHQALQVWVETIFEIGLKIFIKIT